MGKARMLGVNKPYVPNSRADRRWLNKPRQGTAAPQPRCSRDRVIFAEEKVKENAE